MGTGREDCICISPKEEGCFIKAYIAGALDGSGRHTVVEAIDAAISSEGCPILPQLVAQYPDIFKAGRKVARHRERERRRRVKKFGLPDF